VHQAVNSFWLVMNAVGVTTTVGSALTAQRKRAEQQLEHVIDPAPDAFAVAIPTADLNERQQHLIDTGIWE